MEWLRDWGNLFNKAAAKASFIEHLRVLHDKIHPALVSHLELDFKPAMTSSHKEYERTVKTFLDKFFPGRFNSFREFQPAQAFHNRLVDQELWEWFINWSNQSIDFKLASEMDNGTIYKILNGILRKLLVHAPGAKLEVAEDEEVKDNGFELTWIDLVRCLFV